MTLSDIIGILGIVVGLLQVAQSLPSIWKAYRGDKPEQKRDEKGESDGT